MKEYILDTFKIGMSEKEAEKYFSKEIKKMNITERKIYLKNERKYLKFFKILLKRNRKFIIKIREYFEYEISNLFKKEQKMLKKEIININKFNFKFKNMHLKNRKYLEIFLKISYRDAFGYQGMYTIYFPKDKIYINAITDYQFIIIFINNNKEEIIKIAKKCKLFIGLLQIRSNDEEDLESLGRPANDYFKKQYSKNDKAIDLKSDGKDYSNVDFGENVGDKKNEGWDIYTKDIRKEKQPNGKYYTEKEMQDNINNVFGKGKFDIDWKEYEDNEKYRTQSNYYYFQAKYTLKSNKVNEITDDYIIIQNNDKNIKLNIVPPKESLYHNVEFIFKNKTFKISFNNKNKKYTNEDGYEVVLDKNNKIVTDPSNRGTYNMVTYKSIFSKDTYLHAKIDMKLWKKFGTGPDDKSTREIRERLGGSVFGLSVMLFYDILKIESMKNNQNILSKEEINKKLHEIYFSNEKENNGY